jgi:hypothetical protein
MRDRTYIAASLLIVLTVTFNAHAQLPKPPATKPTVFVGPSSLSARSITQSQVQLVWQPVAGASGYRITRIENTGDPEATIAALPASSFMTPRTKCAAGTYVPDCVFTDVSYINLWHPPVNPDLSEPTVVEGAIYPHNVMSGKLYTYRVWALFSNGVVSPPSPPATVQVQ